MEIPLTKGYVTFVDAEDYDELAQFEWYVHFGGKGGGPYAARRSTQNNKQRPMEFMHRRLVPGSQRVDHINHNTLDNRRSNLRAATQRENSQNRSGLDASNTSGFRGVSWDRQRQRWRATIKIDGRSTYLGLFDTAEEAAKAFDAAAVKSFGEFAGFLNYSEEAASHVA